MLLTKEEYAMLENTLHMLHYGLSMDDCPIVQKLVKMDLMRYVETGVISKIKRFTITLAGKLALRDSIVNAN